MDDSCTENNSLITDYNKQVENPTNKRNLASGIELIDENHFITGSKSSLPIRKQRLKEYSTITHHLIKT